MVQSESTCERIVVKKLFFFYSSAGPQQPNHKRKSFLVWTHLNWPCEKPDILAINTWITVLMSFNILYLEVSLSICANIHTSKVFSPSCPASFLIMSQEAWCEQWRPPDSSLCNLAFCMQTSMCTSHSSWKSEHSNLNITASYLFLLK